ncbi:MAG: branched-chain amino acid ABC transporter permease [Chloroflexi bacterium]|nr:branched-chain amino acid ABC transporter permease [Chloroflexota bacterium]
MDLDTLVIQLLAGLTRAGLLFIVSAGLSLVFGAMRVINLAHGSLYMLGAFVASTVVATIGGGWGLFPALVVSAAAAALVGSVIEVGILRRLYRREHLLQLLPTFAIVLIISDIVEIVWGTANLSVARPAVLSGSVPILGRPFPVYNLFIIAAALGTGAALTLLLRRTGLGRDIRAAIVDPEMLGGVGVDVPRLFTVVFVIGSALAGMAGAIAAGSGAVGLGMDVEILVQAFAVTIIGGLGSIPGALVGAGIIGVADAFGILFLPRLTLAIIFLAMAVVLAIRPSGLFGLPERT